MGSVYILLLIVGGVTAYVLSLGWEKQTLREERKEEERRLEEQ